MSTCEVCGGRRTYPSASVCDICIDAGDRFAFAWALDLVNSDRYPAQEILEIVQPRCARPDLRVVAR